MIIRRIIRAIKRRLFTYLVNGPLAGTEAFELKRKLLNSLGHSIGVGTKVVGPVFFKRNGCYWQELLGWT